MRIVLVVCALLAAGATASAQQCLARFSDAPCYLGPPQLGITGRFLAAGGGAGSFSTQRLVQTLAGPRADAELHALRAKFGDDVVRDFLTVDDFVAADAVRLASDAKVTVPAFGTLSARDIMVLRGGLYGMGMMHQERFDAEYMIDHLFSHPIHMRVMDDVDQKFGRKLDATYHIVLQQLVYDLHDLHS
jgi:hypothetical protein